MLFKVWRWITGWATAIRYICLYGINGGRKRLDKKLADIERITEKINESWKKANEANQYLKTIETEEKYEKEAVLVVIKQYDKNGECIAIENINIPRSI